MPANLRLHSNLPGSCSEQPVLYVSLELSWSVWKLAFATDPGVAPRRREMPAREQYLETGVPPAGAVLSDWRGKALLMAGDLTSG